MKDAWLECGCEVIGDVAEGRGIDEEGKDSDEWNESVSPEWRICECSGGVDSEALQDVVCKEGPDRDIIG